ncbi:hypothetical protein K503DRAFT_777675 [Rhizopogon vinicolor AM-OR11-026]|uniref:Uncharacterized protein n=1 Tax=Rhizopogon vinicolor AM-OR11-026 TaxID=1314800 RepID=A0A1B7MFG3_9AGAM|nr:hypothetical protein K503DRAFT_777675 [Rhizopogon vinicolor AM-OR11-026]
MPSFLAKSFETLKIATGQQTEESARRLPFKLDPPKKQSYVQYYGYEVCPYWLIAFAEEHCPEELPDQNAEDYQDVAVMRAYKRISAWSGIHTLEMQDCFNPPKGGTVPPEWFASIFYDDIQPEGVDIVNVLIVCSDQEEKFQGRPSQVHIDFMTKLIGHGPRWWVSCGYADW